MKQFFFSLIGIILISFPFQCVYGQGRVTRTTQSHRTSIKNKELKSPSDDSVKNDANAGSDVTFKIGFSDADTSINGHGYVDLGLPSGIKWATCNIGAPTPEDDGEYFAYGETDSNGSYFYTQDIKLPATRNRNIGYNISDMVSNGYLNFDKRLPQTRNAAIINWGRAWNIPNKDDWYELKRKCKWEWVANDITEGYLVTGPNGKSIFLKSCGYNLFNNTKREGKKGFYASSDYEKLSSYEEQVFIFTFDKEEKKISVVYPERFSVRPVMKIDQTKLKTGYSIEEYDRTSKELMTLSNPDGFINGHGYVDLGLPSGLKWATCNVGATQPEKMGITFRWGEISKPDFLKQSHAMTYEKSLKELKSKKVVNDSGILMPAYDAANVNMGASWRMPTDLDILELINECEWIHTSINGQDGCRVIGPSGKSIFLLEHNFQNEKFHLSYYWTSKADDTCKTKQLLLTEYDVKMTNSFDRDYALPIRAVTM